MPQKSTCPPIELEALATISIEPESPDSGKTLRVCLGSAIWHADDMHHPRSRVDASKGQMDGLHGKTDMSNGQTDALTMLNHAKMAGISHGDEPDMYLGAGDAKHGVRETDGIGSHADTSNGSTDIPSVETDANRPAITPEIISTCPIESKPPDPPTRGRNSCTNELDGCRNPVDTLNVATDVPSIQTDVITPTDTPGRVRTTQKRLKMSNSPYTCETATLKPSC